MENQYLPNSSPSSVQPYAMQANSKLMPTQAKISYEDVKVNLPAYTSPAYTAGKPYTSTASILVLFILLVIITRTYQFNKC